MVSDQNPYVLLAEDNPAEINLFQIAMRDSGINATVEIVNTGQEVLNFLAAEGEFSQRDVTHLPELIILDLNLPLLNGFEVLAILRREEVYAQLPIIIFTSSESIYDWEKARKLGATEFIQKPIEYSDFVNSIATIFRKWVKIS